MEAHITTRRSIGTFRTALILGGIIVAILALPFLLRGDFNTSVIPRLNVSSKDVIHQTNVIGTNLISDIVFSGKTYTFHDFKSGKQ